MPSVLPDARRASSRRFSASTPSSAGSVVRRKSCFKRLDFSFELLSLLVRPRLRAHRRLDLVVNEGAHEIALRFDLELGGHARRTLAAVGEGEQPASCGRQLNACLDLRRLHALEEDRGRVAKDERRAEPERPDQLGALAPRRAAVRTDERTAVLLVPERQSAVAWPVGDAPAGFSVEPEAAGGRGRIGREKPLPGGGLFLLRRVIPGVVRILRPAIVLACAVEGELVPWRVAQRRRQARTRFDSLQERLAAFKAA